MFTLSIVFQVQIPGDTIPVQLPSIWSVGTRGLYQDPQASDNSYSPPSGDESADCSIHR